MRGFCTKYQKKRMREKEAKEGEEGEGYLALPRKGWSPNEKRQARYIREVVKRHRETYPGEGR